MAEILSISSLISFVIQEYALFLPHFFGLNSKFRLLSGIYPERRRENP